MLANWGMLKNHSAWKHVVVKVPSNNVTPTEIVSVTGHKNVQTILNYYNVTVEQHKNILTLFPISPLLTHNLIYPCHPHTNTHASATITPQRP